MDIHKYRTMARIVGYIDLMLSSIGLVAVMIFISLTSVAATVDRRYNTLGKEVEGINSTQTISNVPSQNVRQAFSVDLMIMKVAGVTSVLVAILSYYAAFKLTESTKIGIRPKEAQKMAKFWRNVNFTWEIVFIVYTCWFIRSWNSDVLPLVTPDFVSFIVVCWNYFVFFIFIRPIFLFICLQIHWRAWARCCHCCK